MANTKMLTASNIRYLLAVRELGRADGGARCIDIAAALKLSKPSVHNMMDSLARNGFVCKNAYGMVYLTDAGREAAERYARYYTAVASMLMRNFPNTADLRDAACLLSEIPDADLEALCVRGEDVRRSDCLQA